MSPSTYGSSLGKLMMEAVTAMMYAATMAAANHGRAIMGRWGTALTLARPRDTLDDVARSPYLAMRAALLLLLLVGTTCTLAISNVRVAPAFALFGRADEIRGSRFCDSFP